MMKKILLTGSTGYVGRRLLPALISSGHYVYCLVRDRRRFNDENLQGMHKKKYELIEADLLKEEDLFLLPKDIDAAYYFVHSMAMSFRNFSKWEDITAKNFSRYLSFTNAKQVVYLGGILPQESLSEHLSSRQHVEDILKSSNIPLTVLRAAIIIGSGSASFEIIRDLVEKLPVMITPKWLLTKCQPIAIKNVIEYLVKVLFESKTFHQTYDIGGTSIYTYKDMLLNYAKKRGFRRFIVTFPVLTPRISSLWLYFVTSTSYPLARSLVDSMKHEVICHERTIDKIISVQTFTYEQALDLAFAKIETDEIVSSWKDALQYDGIDTQFLNHSTVPQYGVFKDHRKFSIQGDIHLVMKKIWGIGDKNGWYYGNFLWKFRGFIDQILGGVGLTRGRRSQTQLKIGDSLDFWRVQVADKKKRRLLLYAEMKLPGEAWLEMRIDKENGKYFFKQNATFRPSGLFGRLYWLLAHPFHELIFQGMGKKISNPIA